MTLQMAKCPNCGGIIKVSPEKEAAICEYCDTPFIVEKAINNYNIEHMHADTFTYHQARSTNKWDLKMEEARLDAELERDPEYNKSRLIVLGVVVVLFIFSWISFMLI